MFRQSSKSVVASSPRNVLKAAVKPLFEGLEKRSLYSVNIAPTAVAGGPYSVNEGQSIQISGLASTDSDGSVARYEWDTNYNALKGFKVRATTGSWTFHADTSGTRTIALRVIDNDNGVSTIQTATINIADVAPTISLTAPNSVDEGKPVSINWSYSDVGKNDNVTAWNVDWGDGTTGTFAGDISQASHTYSEDGSFDIELTSTQAERTTSVTHTINVINDGPVVEATTPKDTIDEGEMVQLDFKTLNRVGTLDSWTIDWGDGKSDVLEPTRSHAAHFFTDSGVYTATIMAQEPDGGFGQQTVVFTVNNVAPEITITNTPATGNEGSAITLGSTKTDAGQDDTHTYGWTVYRDGELFTLPNGTNTSGTSFTFTPTDNGSYVVRLSVMDDEGAVATVNSDAIEVANVAPTGIISGTPGTISEGTTVNLGVTPSDAGSEDTFGYAWSVTKNNAPYALPLNAVTDAANFTFKPGDNGTYVATVVITDDDGDTVSVSTTAITVTNATPTATVTGAPASIDETNPIEVSANVTDAGQDDTHSYQWSVEKITRVNSPENGTMTTANSGTVASRSWGYTAGTEFTLAARVDLGDIADGQVFDVGRFLNNQAVKAIVIRGYRSGGNVTIRMMGGDNNNSGMATLVLPESSLTNGYMLVAATYDYNTSTGTIHVDGNSASGTIVYAPGNVGSVEIVPMAKIKYDFFALYNSVLSPSDLAALAQRQDTSVQAHDFWDFDDNVGSNVAKSTGTAHANMTVSNVTFSGVTSYVPVTLVSDVVTTDKDFTFVPSDNGEYRIKLTVTDKDGASVNAQSNSIIVNNIAPVGTISGEEEAVEGDALNFNVDVVDAGDDTQTYSWSVKKDGQTYTLPNGTVTNTDAFGFTPDDNGSYEVSVLVTDKDGDSSTATHTVTVANAAPSVTIDNAPTTGVEGSAINAGSTATDAGANEALTYAWSVKKDGHAYTLDNSVTVNGDSFAFTPSDNGTYVLTLKVTDKDGDSKTVDSQPIVVANAAPTATISGEPGNAIVEGDPVSLTVTPLDAGTLDTFTYAWSIKKDGQAFNPGSGVSLTGDTLNFIATGNGTYVATVVVTDKDGDTVSVDSDPIVAANAPPTATIDNTPATGNEGSAITVGSTVTDAGQDTHTYAWTVETYNGSVWSAVSLGSNVAVDGEAFTFTPADNGTYRVSLTVTDQDGADVTVHSTDIVVANVNPTGSISGVSTANEGSAVALTATASDVGSLDTLSYQWSVTKDAQPVTLPNGTVSNLAAFSYTPADQGEYVFTCLVTDKDGGTKSLTHTVSVANVSPSVALTNVPSTGQEGTAVTVNSTVTDPGDDTLTYGWTVYRNQQLFALPNGTTTNGTSFTFTPTDNGSYVVRLTVIDEDGGSTTKNSTGITVANVAPVAAITGSTTGTEGQAVNLGSTVTDAGAEDQTAGFTYAWTAKRGNTTVATASTASFAFTPSVHGTYAITLVATDKDGLATTTTSQVNVANVAPTGTAIAGSLSNVKEGDAVSLTASATDVSGDTLSYAWQIKKGQTVFASGNTKDIAFTAARGDYTLTVTVTDTAGATDSKVSNFTVANVAPTGSMVAPTDTVLINTNANFTLTANDAQANQALSVVWDFGDGSGTQHDLVAGQSIVRKHAYAARGNYTVTATISDGVTQTVVTKTIFVAEAAVISDPNDTNKQSLIVVGTEGNDTIDVAQQQNGKYAVTFNGASLGTSFTPTSRIYVYGNGGANTITVSGTTNAVVFAGSQGSNVTTGAGNDVIVGSSGVDRLNGGGGRDIVIGAEGADILRGGDGEDIVVAGSLTKMNDTSSAVSMMNSWGDTSLQLAQRRNNLYSMFSKQLINDAGSNQLYGEAGNDWFVLNSAADRLKDFVNGDVIN